MATEVRFRKGGPADAKEEPEGARSTQQRRRVTTHLLGLLILAALVMTAIFVKVHYHFTLVHYAHLGGGGQIGSASHVLLGDAAGRRRQDSPVQCLSPWCEKAADLSGALEQIVQSISVIEKSFVPLQASQMVAASDPLPTEAEIKPSLAHDNMVRLMKFGQPNFAGMVQVVQGVVDTGQTALQADPDKERSATPPAPISLASHGAEEGNEDDDLAGMEEGEGASPEAGSGHGAGASEKSEAEAGTKPKSTFESIIHLLGKTTAQSDATNAQGDGAMKTTAASQGPATSTGQAQAEGGATQVQEQPAVGGAGTGHPADGASTVHAAAATLDAGAAGGAASLGAGDAQGTATISDDDFMKKLEEAGKALDQHLRVEDGAALSETDLAQLEALVQELERAEKERLGGVHQLLINRMRALDEQPRCMGQPPEWTKVAMGVAGGAASLDNQKHAGAAKKHVPARRQLLAVPSSVSSALSAPAGGAHASTAAHHHGDTLSASASASSATGTPAAAATTVAGAVTPHGHPRAQALPGGATTISSLAGSKGMSASLLAELADLTEDGASSGGPHGGAAKGAAAASGGDKHEHSAHHHGADGSAGASSIHTGGSAGGHAVSSPAASLGAQELASSFTVDARTALEKSKKVHLISGLGTAGAAVGPHAAASSGLGGASSSGAQQHPHGQHAGSLAAQGGHLPAHHPTATSIAASGAHASLPHGHDHSSTLGHGAGGPGLGVRAGDTAARHFHEGRSVLPGGMGTATSTTGLAASHAAGGWKHHPEADGAHVAKVHTGMPAHTATGLAVHGHAVIGSLGAPHTATHGAGAAGHAATSAGGAAGGNHPAGSVAAHVASLMAHKQTAHGGIPVHGVGLGVHAGHGLHGPHGGHARPPSLPHRTHPPPGAPAAPVAMKSGEMTVIGLDDHHVVIETEHGPRPERQHYHKRRVNTNRGPLVDCLHDLSKCGRKARHAAHRVPGMQDVVLGQPRISDKLYKSCAIVGNGGGLMKHAYGDYIDQHEVVVRVNILPMQKYRKHIGQRSTFRVLSYKVSLELVYGFAPFWTKTKNETLVIWFPANRADVATRMHARLPTFGVLELGDDALESMANVFKSLEAELYKLQMGPFTDWEFMSSGMHAVLAFLRVCNAVNLYGFTLDTNTRAPYWFTGRLKPPTSAVKYISQDLEAMVLRLLYAAGFVNVCSM